MDMLQLIRYGTLLAKILPYMKMHIAKLLVKENIVSLEQIKEAIEKKCDTDMELSEALVELGYITEPEILDFLAKSYGVPVISIEDHSVEQEVLDLIPREIAIENRLIPLSVTGSALTVAMSDPSNLILVDKLNFLTEKNIIPVVVSERSITSMLEQYHNYNKNDTDFSKLSAQHTAKDDIDMQDMVKELQDYMDDDTSGIGINESTEENTHSTLNEETSNQEQVNFETDAFDTDAPDSNQEPMDEAEPNEPVSLEETRTEDESTFSDESSGVSSENFFINAPDQEDSEEVPEDRVQNSEDVEGINDKSAELTSSFPDLSSVNESSGISKELEVETHAQTIVPDQVDTTAPAKESTTSKATPAGVNPSVLVIDDSRTVQKLIILALNRHGYKVSAVSDGMEALSCLNDVKPNLIFIEINLPHMDGYRLCKIIKSHGLMKQVPVIMLSGKDGLVDKVRSKMAGANGHISKPFSANELVDAAKRFTSSNPKGIASGKS